MRDAPRADQDPVVQAYKEHIDRTLIRENLKLTVEERFRKAMALARFADELRRAGRESGRPKGMTDFGALLETLWRLHRPPRYVPAQSFTRT
jgi:hypothetical protein